MSSYDPGPCPDSHSRVPPGLTNTSCGLLRLVNYDISSTERSGDVAVVGLKALVVVDDPLNLHHC